LLDVPSILYGQTEVYRHGRANRAFPEEIRHRLFQEEQKRPEEIVRLTGYNSV